MLIWVTRTAPENLATAARLRQLGHEPILVPVLDVRRVPAHAPSVVPAAIVFTSVHGVRHHPLRHELRNVPVFTVGDRTAAQAALAGYLNVRSAKGDVVALARLIRDQLPAPGRLTHYSGRDVAGDLGAMLRRFGYLVERRVVYVAQEVATRWLVEVRQALPSIGGIVVHSPRAAERVARVLSGSIWNGTVWCISDACVRRLASVPAITARSAAQPSEDGLIELIRRGTSLRPSTGPTANAAGLRASATGTAPPIPANDDDGPRSPDYDPDNEPPPAA